MGKDIQAITWFLELNREMQILLVRGFENTWDDTYNEPTIQTIVNIYDICHKGEI